jgi:hypothetical protein
LGTILQVKESNEVLDRESKGKRNLGGNPAEQQLVNGLDGNSFGDE